MKELLEITDKNGDRIGLSDIVGDVYRNGYWFGIVEKPDIYGGTVVAVRVLDYWGIFFYDFPYDGYDWKYLIKSKTKDYQILHSSFSGEYDVHPSRLKYCQFKAHNEYCDENGLCLVVDNKGNLQRGKEIKMKHPYSELSISPTPR